MRSGPSRRAPPGSYGAEIVRFAVPDMAAAKGLKAVTAASPVPIVADIHFDYRLALEAVDSGVHALRINPGNIGADENVVKVVEKVRSRQIPIRIGINAGSLPEDLLEANGGHPTAEAWWKGLCAISVSWNGWITAIWSFP